MRLTPLKIILLIVLVDLIGFGLIIPILPTYARRLGAGGFTLGLLIACYPLMQFIFCPILGRWSDLWGRRPILIISMLGSVGSHSLLGLGDLCHSLPLLFVARLLDGITGANVATAQAYIADVTPPTERARGMGLFGATFGLGFVLGPAFGALLAGLGKQVSGEHGTAWPAFGAAAFSATATILLYLFLPEPQKAAPEAGRASAAGVFLWRLTTWQQIGSGWLPKLIGLAVATQFAFVFVEVTFTFACQDALGLREAGVSLGYVYIGVFIILVQGFLLSRAVRRWGETRLVRMGPLLTGLGMFMVGTALVTPAGLEVWLRMGLGGGLVAIGSGLTNPTLHSLISRNAPEGRQGMVLGLAQGLVSMARILCPLLAGALYDVEAELPYAVSGVLFLLIVGFAVKTLNPAILDSVRKESGRDPSAGAAPVAVGSRHE